MYMNGTPPSPVTRVSDISGAMSLPTVGEDAVQQLPGQLLTSEENGLVVPLCPPMKGRQETSVFRQSGAREFFREAKQRRSLNAFSRESDGLIGKAQKLIRRKAYGEIAAFIDQMHVSPEITSTLIDMFDLKSMYRLDAMIKSGKAHEILSIQKFLQNLVLIVNNPIMEADSVLPVMSWARDAASELGLKVNFVRLVSGSFVTRIVVNDTPHDKEIVLNHAGVDFFDATTFLYDEKGLLRTDQEYKLFWEDIIRIVPDRQVPDILFQFGCVEDLGAFIKAIYIEENEDHFLNVRLIEALLGMKELELQSVFAPFSLDEFWDKFLSNPETQAVGTSLLIGSLVYGGEQHAREIIKMYERIALNHLGEWHQNIFHVVQDMALFPHAVPAHYVILKQTAEWAISHNTMEERFIIACRGLGSSDKIEYEHALREAKFLLNRAFRLTKIQLEVLAARILAVMDRDYFIFKPLLEALSERLATESAVLAEVCLTLHVREKIRLDINAVHDRKQLKNVIQPVLEAHDSHSLHALTLLSDWNRLHSGSTLGNGFGEHSMIFGPSFIEREMISATNLKNVSFEGISLTFTQIRQILANQGSVRGAILHFMAEDYISMTETDIQLLNGSGIIVTRPFLCRAYDLGYLPDGIDLSRLRLWVSANISSDELLWFLRNNGNFNYLNLSYEALLDVEFESRDLPILTAMLECFPLSTKIPRFLYSKNILECLIDTLQAEMMFMGSYLV